MARIWAHRWSTSRLKSRPEWRLTIIIHLKEMGISNLDSRQATFTSISKWLIPIPALLTIQSLVVIQERETTCSTDTQSHYKTLSNANQLRSLCLMVELLFCQSIRLSLQKLYCVLMVKAWKYMIVVTLWMKMSEEEISLSASTSSSQRRCQRQTKKS